MSSVYFNPTYGGDGSTVTDDSDPSTGLGNGGHRTRFVPSLAQVVAVAANAVTSATNASSQVTLAAAQVALATTQAGNAAASASSAVSAPGTSATSSTSLTIGTGSKSLTIQSGKSIVVGMPLTIAYTTTPTNAMFGVCTAYDSGTGALTVSVNLVSGSGTFSAWTVSLSGPASAADLPTVIHAAADKATPVDADELPLTDSAASFGLKHLTWANLKATAKAYFDGIYANLTSPSITTPTLTNPTITNYVETIYAPAANSAWTVSLTNGTLQKLTTNANATITLPASVAGKSFTIIVAFGGVHTLTWAGGGTLKWVNGSAPAATSVNGKFDIFTFIQDGTNTFASTFGQNH